MAALIEIIIEGVKKVSSEIIAAVLLLIAFAIFPSLKKLFRKKTNHTMRKLNTSLNNCKTL